MGSDRRKASYPFGSDLGVACTVHSAFVIAAARPRCLAPDGTGECAALYQQGAAHEARGSAPRRLPGGLLH